jgi:HD-GYP domain-containing protein (c-di-GMP phosphodiesterase class II)
MKLDEKVIENVLYVGKFHDVGKIDLPRDVLNKPGKLSTEEYEMVKTHSQVGHDIVLDQTGDAHFARIVLEHHEKLNGSGYPNGLKGDAISMEAKVILVADSFDAMTSDRPYRKAMSNQEALEELKRFSGIWYDPAVVCAMEDLIKNFGSHLG